MLNAREIMELQNLAGMEKFSKRTVAEELERSKLIELLNKSFDEQYSKRGLLTAPHTAEDLIAHGVTVQEWISVKDRLPERFRYVLLWDSADRDFFMGVLRDNGEWYVPGYQDEPFNITHWMPLPQPPKGE